MEFFIQGVGNRELAIACPVLSSVRSQCHTVQQQEHFHSGDRSPDAAWIKLDRWEALTLEEQEKFPPICPDFVIELRSRTDALKPLQEKMQEYLNSGLRLGWLINPQDEEVEIYHPNQAVEIVGFPVSLSGEDILPGFVLNLPL